MWSKKLFWSIPKSNKKICWATILYKKMKQLLNLFYQKSIIWIQKSKTRKNFWMFYCKVSKARKNWINHKLFKQCSCKWTSEESSQNIKLWNKNSYIRRNTHRMKKMRVLMITVRNWLRLTKNKDLMWNYWKRAYLWRKTKNKRNLKRKKDWKKKKKSKKKKKERGKKNYLDLSNKSKTINTEQYSTTFRIQKSKTCLIRSYNLVKLSIRMIYWLMNKMARNSKKWLYCLKALLLENWH